MGHSETAAKFLFGTDACQKVDTSFLLGVENDSVMYFLLQVRERD